MQEKETIEALTIPHLAKLAAALAKAQGAIEGAKKDRKNDHFRSKYADLASCWDACREALSNNGLSVIQFPIEAPLGSVGLLTVLLHESGETIANKFYMPVKDHTNPQAVGSAITYARRYALCAVVGIAPEEDDGNAASTPAQRKETSTAPMSDAVNKLEAKFSASDLQGKKAVFAELREAGLPEAIKLDLMKKFSDAIKEAASVARSR